MRLQFNGPYKLFPGCCSDDDDDVGGGGITVSNLPWNGSTNCGKRESLCLVKARTIINSITFRQWSDDIKMKHDLTHIISVSELIQFKHAETQTYIYFAFYHDVDKPTAPIGTSENVSRSFLRPTLFFLLLLLSRLLHGKQIDMFRYNDKR